jgi:hypothetical protein
MREVEIGPGVHCEKIVDGNNIRLSGVWIFPLAKHIGPVSVDGGDGQVILHPGGPAPLGPVFYPIGQNNTPGHSWRISLPWNACAIAVLS